MIKAITAYFKNFILNLEFNINLKSWRFKLVLYFLKKEYKEEFEKYKFFLEKNKFSQKGDELYRLVSEDNSRVMCFYSKNRNDLDTVIISLKKDNKELMKLKLNSPQEKMLIMMSVCLREKCNEERQKRLKQKNIEREKESKEKMEKELRQLNEKLDSLSDMRNDFYEQSKQIDLKEEEYNYSNEIETSKDNVISVDFKRRRAV